MQERSYCIFKWPFRAIITSLILLFSISDAFCANDTLRVMSYNVLYYGDRPPCQGAHSLSHGYLRQIINYTRPDIIGLEKMAAIPLFSGDHSGSAPLGFGDSVLDLVFNVYKSGKYAYGLFTNNAEGDNINLLVYNTEKLGCVSVVSVFSDITDFDTYKLYYKDADLGTTHDTLFLYVSLNHTHSGSSLSDAAIRSEQITGELNGIRAKFSKLPNMINMGDFNTHNSSEACYQALVGGTDSNYIFYDPPFAVDGLLSYPLDWDSFPYLANNFLTTSTRFSASDPNSCGTSGGGKSWYDHIFISGPIKKGTDRILYLKDTYQTLGNDGNRVGISVNGPTTNFSAPDSVIQAIYQVSNKYPVVASFLVAPPGTAVRNVAAVTDGIWVENPIRTGLNIHFGKDWDGAQAQYICSDLLGRVVAYGSFPVTTVVSLPVEMVQGSYVLKILGSNGLSANVFLTHW